MEATALESVDAVTPEWMTAVLARNGIAATIGRVTTEPVGTGQMGSCYRLFISYDAGVGPDRLIVKLPATDAASRAAGQLGYRCETTFYREIAERLRLDIPRCYFAAMNECGDGFTIVLEDLAPAQQGDQITGCTVDQARAAAVNVAGLHAPTWNDPSLRELDWLIPDLAAYPEVAAAFLVDATKQFLERYTVTRDTAATLQRFADRFVDWATGRPEPFAMLHSDYRLDNLLFAASDAARPVVAVDWQVVMVGLPLRDVAFLVATGLSTESRRRGEKGIVDAYHRRLVELGVDGYSAERCWEDYRYGLFQCPFITVLGAFVAQPTVRGDEMFTVMAERSAAAITDLDAMSLL
ncbi:MAG: phosphotransferase [Mycobacterium sp.]|uniref:phosphotransferase n=3 Tax=Mycobacterium sp. TaxID=1785 RepID=UPI003BB7C42D